MPLPLPAPCNIVGSSLLRYIDFLINIDNIYLVGDNGKNWDWGLGTGDWDRLDKPVEIAQSLITNH
jgi:hypothetical protein